MHAKSHVEIGQRGHLVLWKLFLHRAQEGPVGCPVLFKVPPESTHAERRAEPAPELFILAQDLQTTRPIRHLVAISEELSKTRAGGNPTARRTILCHSDPKFVLYRIGTRFGLPVLAEWSERLGEELEYRRAIAPLIGIGCAPVVVKGTKKRFLGWIGHALKRGAIRIPEDSQTRLWQTPISFEDREQESA